jgi:hypothetical protein
MDQTESSPPGRRPSRRCCGCFSQDRAMIDRTRPRVEPDDPNVGQSELAQRILPHQRLELLATRGDREDDFTVARSWSSCDQEDAPRVLSSQEPDVRGGIGVDLRERHREREFDDEHAHRARFRGSSSRCGGGRHRPSCCTVRVSVSLTGAVFLAPGTETCFGVPAPLRGDVRSTRALPAALCDWAVRCA